MSVIYSILKQIKYLSIIQFKIPSLSPPGQLS